MKIKIRGLVVEVVGDGARVAVKSHLFQNWVKSLDKSMVVSRVTIQSMDTVVRQGVKSVLFMKIKAEVADSAGRKLPGVVFLRGGSVGVLMILKTKKDEYVVLVKSAYVATGVVNSTQLPAGMLDGEENAALVASREMMEEVGYGCDEKKLVDLTKIFYGDNWKGIYPSSGACDEVIQLFLYEQSVDEKTIRQLQGQRTGLEHENEHLTLQLVKLDELCRSTPDVKAHSAYVMYKQLKSEGKI